MIEHGLWNCYFTFILQSGLLYTPKLKYTLDLVLRTLKESKKILIIDGVRIESRWNYPRKDSTFIKFTSRLWS